MTDLEARTRDLRRSWDELREQLPKLGTREAAAALGASEAELLATQCGDRVVRLDGDFGRLVTELGVVGPVVAITRNGRAIHEKRGVYGNAYVAGHVGLVQNGPIDLRLFLDHWRLGFAVDDGRRRSFQFFDADGSAVHKVAMDPGGDHRAFDALVARYAGPDQSPEQPVKPRRRRREERPDREVNVLGLRAAWCALQEPHDFLDLMTTFGVTRQQALRLAGSDYAYRVPRRSVADVLRWVSAAGTAVMVIVSSEGVVQVHTGPIHRVYASGRWLYVRDFGFNLQLRADRIASSWIVRRPSRDGDVTALELFDPNGETIALMFGERKPGLHEPAAWRAVLERLPALRTAA
jgi:putative hemin transport protein